MARANSAGSASGDRSGLAPRIFIVDDDSMIRMFVEGECRREGYRVEAFPDGPSVLAALEKETPNLLFTDLVMEGMGGFEVLEAAKRLRPNLSIVMLTSSSDISDALRAIRSGAFDYVTKPIDSKRLMEVVRRALRVAELEGENRRIIEELRRRDEKMQKELAMARKIQRALIPKIIPRLHGFDIGMHFVPSGDIGGDFYDFFNWGDTKTLGLLFADITGHGVPAALLSSMFKAMTAEILHARKPGAEYFSTLNRRVTQVFPDGNFASAFFAVLDSERMRMTYVKASQEPVLIFREGEAPILIEEGGPLLGAYDPAVFGEPEYPEVEVDLRPGDTVLIFTDGLVEVENRAGKMLRLEGLLEWMKEDIVLVPPVLVKRLYERAVAYAGTTELADDFTVMAIRTS